MTKKRELDSITPDFSLTSEQVVNLKRILVDDEYAEEVGKKQEKRHKERLKRLKNTILTGKGAGGIVLPKYYLDELRERYESMTGEMLYEKKEL